MNLPPLAVTNLLMTGMPCVAGMEVGLAVCAGWQLETTRHTSKPNRANVLRFGIIILRLWFLGNRQNIGEDMGVLGGFACPTPPICSLATVVPREPC